MLRKRDLPTVAKLDIEFDIDKIKHYIDSLDQGGWGDVYESNEGITNFANADFIRGLEYNDFKEYPCQYLRPEYWEEMKNPSTDLGKSKTEVYKNKHERTNKLSPVGNEHMWDYDMPHYTGSYIHKHIAENFKAESCRTRIHWLPKGKEIQPHIDYDASYAVRIVVPISGTDNVINAFWPKNQREEYNLKADGSAYFINIGYKHAVEHNGSEDRIALLFTLKSQEDVENYAIRKET